MMRNKAVWPVVVAALLSVACSDKVKAFLLGPSAVATPAPVATPVPSPTAAPTPEPVAVAPVLATPASDAMADASAGDR